MGYLNGVSDGRGMDTSPAELSPVDTSPAGLSPVDRKYVNHMRSVNYIDSRDNDVAYLKYMIAKFRFNQLLLIYLAIYTAKKDGFLPGSLLEFDHEIMYVSVSTKNRSKSCIVGYDVDHYTLQWYRVSIEGSLPVYARVVLKPNLQDILDSLIRNYHILNADSKTR